MASGLQLLCLVTAVFLVQVKEAVTPPKCRGGKWQITFTILALLLLSLNFVCCESFKVIIQYCISICFNLSVLLQVLYLVTFNIHYRVKNVNMF